MTVDDVGESDRLIGDLFRQAALPAATRTVLDLASGRPAALKILTGDVTEPMDAATVARALNLMQVNGHRPSGPVLFDVPLTTLVELTDAGQYSEHPLVLSLDAGEMLDRPAETLRLVDAARLRGWEIGLHGVGRTFGTLAAVSVYEPALVTLDPRVISDPTSPLAMETLQTLTAFTHSTGATVMAERLATRELHEVALGLGATLGRGAAVRNTWHELPPHLDYTLDLFTPPPLPDQRKSPFDIAAQRHQPRQARKGLLVALSKQLETVALTSGRSTLVFADFQYAEKVTPSTRRRYAELVPNAEMIMMAAKGLRTVPVPGVAIVELQRGDPLINEWVVLILGPTAAALLTARDLRLPARREADREFSYVLTYDRDLVAHAARSLLTRLSRR
jgi:EAL domain-containing protein (putative c-di-GMP-specific phosphodiesterase class I)